MEKIEIGFPMEYEDDKNIIRTGLWLKEHEVELLEKKLKENEQLKKQKEDVVEYIKEAMHSDSFTELPSGEKTDICYCIPAFKDLLRMLGEIDE